MSWGHCRFIRFISFGPGSESNESNASKVAPRPLDSDITPDSRASDPDASNGYNASQVLALGPTLDSLDSFDSLDSDQGSNQMNLVNREWHPGLWIQTRPLDARASESDASNGSNASHVLALGPTLNSFRCIRCGPGADVDGSTGTKVLALGPALDSLDSLDAFDALDSEAPEGPGGNLDLKAWGAL